MFVFPAFNESYSNRKRTYKCCRKCRSKRIRCSITTTNYDEKGCDNCRESGYVCDLIQEKYRKKEPSGSPMTSDSLEDSKSPYPVQQSAPITGNGMITNQITNGPPGPGHGPYPSPQYQIPQGSPTTGFPPQFYPMPAPGMTQDSNQVRYPPNPNPIIQPQASPTANQAGYLGVPMLQNAQTQPYVYYSPYQQMQPMTPPSGPQKPPAHLPHPMAPSNSGISQQYMAYQPVDQPAVFPPNRLPARQEPVAGPSQTIQFQKPPKKQLDELPEEESDEQPVQKKTKLNENQPMDAEYLKLNYNFNICWSTYKYTFSRIPTNDNTYVSGANSVLRPKAEAEAEPKPENKHNKALGAIKSAPMAKFLTEIEAFTVSDSEYHITKEQERQLIEIYFEKINLLFPILDEPEFWNKYNQDKQSTIVIFSIILVVSRDNRSRPILESVFNSNQSADSAYDNQQYSTQLTQFLDKLELKIRQLLLVLSDLGDNDKLNRLVTHLLLSMNFSNNKFGNEQSNQDLYSSISLAFALLIHRKLFHQNLIKTNQIAKSNYLRRLWWVLLVFDRFNAVINSKAFLIKRSDFDITYPDDTSNPNDKLFQELLDNIKILEEVIFIIYQPNQDYKKVKQYEEFINSELNNLNDDNFKAHLETLSSQCAGGDKRPLIFSCQLFMMKKLINNLIIIIIDNFTIMVTKTQHLLSDISIKCCSNVINHLAVMKKCEIDFDIMLCIPIVPSLLSLFLAHMLKYKLKIVYLAKFNQLHNRPDVDVNKIRLLNSLFENYHLILLQNFGNWWFIRQILKTLEVFINGAKDPNRSVTEVNDSKFLANNKHDQSDHKTGKKSSKLDISSIVSQEESVVPPIVSISSPTFYSQALEEESLFGPNQKQIPRPTPTESQEPPGVTSSVTDNDSQGPTEKLTASPPAVDKDMYFDTLEEAGDLLKNVEERQIFEMINEGFFGGSNLSGFVTEDPTLKDFFVSM